MPAHRRRQPWTPALSIYSRLTAFALMGSQSRLSRSRAANDQARRCQSATAVSNVGAAPPGRVGVRVGTRIVDINAIRQRLPVPGLDPRNRICQTRTPPPKSQCHSSSKRLAPSGAAISVIPVMLPPGRVRLAMRPVLLGSAARLPITVGTEARERLTTRGGT